MIDTVEDRWRALLARGEPEMREVDPEEPTADVIGVSPVGRPYFAVIVAQKLDCPISRARSKSRDGNGQRTALDTDARATGSRSHRCVRLAGVGTGRCKSALAASEQAALDDLPRDAGRVAGASHRPRRPAV